MPNVRAGLEWCSPRVLSLFRIVVGLVFFLRGTQKLFDWPTAAPMAIPTGSWPFWWAGLIEIVVGTLLALGLVTRLAAFVGSGQMAIAYFMQHQPKGSLPIQNDGELVVVLCFGFFLLVFLGGGAWALDAKR